MAKALVYGSATYMLRSEDFDSLSTAHHKLLLGVAGFRSKSGNGYETLSNRTMLEMTSCEPIHTTIRKRQLCFAGALVWQKKTRLPKRIMNARSAARGPMRVEAGHPTRRWEENLEESLRALG
ncbi:unnamed protein product, partial [Sphacelaria rigidula]